MSHVVEQPPAVPIHAGPRWLPLNVGTALVLATVLGLLTFLLTSTGESVTQAADAERQVVEAVPTTEFEAADFAAATSFPALARAGAITNMGPTEIGYVTNFPSVSYTWERIELPGASISDTGWLGNLNGQFVAVSPGWDDVDSETQILITRTSSDALDWKVAGTYQLPTDAWVSRIVGNGDLVVALAERWVPESTEAERFLLTTSDGASWSTSALVLDAEPEEHVFIEDIAIGAAGIVISVGFETYPEEQPRVFLFDPYEVVLDHMRGTLTLTDTGSGDVVLTGTIDDILSWSTDGQAIYDPETSELLVTIPYDIWERSYQVAYGGGYSGSPLPIPIGYREPATQAVVTIDYEGFLVEVDEYAGQYVVTDVASGEELAAGPLGYLYQGPPPFFTDPETGEVILAVTWEEWYQAEEQPFSDMIYEQPYYYESRARAAFVTSTDLVTWDVEVVADGVGGSTSYLAATSDGFVAMVNSYGEGGEWGTVWTMSGGKWTSTETERTDLWLRQITTTEQGLVGVGDGSGGPALWSSPDGVSWSSEFAIIPQNDGTHTWLSDVANDGAGTLGTLAVHEKRSECNPLVIEQDRYTATFEDGEILVRVTETVNGNEVFSLTRQDFEEGIANDLIDWEDGATSIGLGNGDMMVITDDEAYAALETRYADTGQMGLSVFLNDGTGWAEAVVDVEGGISGASQLFLADGKIIIGGSYWGMEGESYYEGPVDSAFVIIVGTPRGG